MEDVEATVSGLIYEMWNGLYDTHIGLSVEDIYEDEQFDQLVDALVSAAGSDDEEDLAFELKRLDQSLDADDLIWLADNDPDDSGPAHPASVLAMRVHGLN